MFFRSLLYLDLVAFIALVSFFSFFGFSSQGLAIESQETSLSVSPAIIDLPVRKGQTYIQKLRITNAGNQPVPIAYSSQSLFVDEDGISENDRQRFDASSWIDLPETADVYAQDQTIILEFEVVVPADATPGGHYAAIALQALTPVNSATVAPEITVTVFLKVAGPVYEELNMDVQDIFPRYATASEQRHSQLRITNNGNVHEVVVPELVFVNGNNFETKTLRPQIILPGTSRVFEDGWTMPEVRGEYYAYVRLRYGASRQYEYITPRERVIVGYSVSALAGMAGFSWCGAYLVGHRRHVRRAISVLRRGYHS